MASDTLIIGPNRHSSTGAIEAWNAAYEDKNGDQFFVFSGENYVDEDDVFAGYYDKIRDFYDVKLPEMRRLLLQNLEGKQRAEIYMGGEIGTLYAAYYCAVAGVRFSVNLLDPQFVGGRYPWSEQHPLLLNRLITTVLSRAGIVRIAGSEHYELLPKAFPKIDRIWDVYDPESGKTAGPETLHSHANGQE